MATADVAKTKVPSEGVKVKPLHDVGTSQEDGDDVYLVPQSAAGPALCSCLKLLVVPQYAAGQLLCGTADQKTKQIRT